MPHTEDTNGAMRNLLVVSVFTALFSLLAPTRLAEAQEAGRFGLGIVLGEPSGVIGKYNYDDTFALDFAVGLGLFGGNHVNARVDALWQFDIKQWSAGSLDWYVGVGAQFGFFFDDYGPGRRDNGSWVGARVPFGLRFFFTVAPFDVFAEIAPGLWFVQDARFDFEGCIGGRFWF
jgi:hypothetical protein